LNKEATNEKKIVEQLGDTEPKSGVKEAIKTTEKSLKRLHSQMVKCM
jgi:hypothetical protein